MLLGDSADRRQDPIPVGGIVLKDKRVLYRKSFQEDVPAIETAVEPAYHAIEGS